MAKTYDIKNKLNEKHKKEIEEKDILIQELTNKLQAQKTENDELRRKLYEVGEGKGENHRLRNELHSKDVENKTLSNTIKDLDGSKLISTFIPQRQELIKKIKKLKFSDSTSNFLAYKFSDGLDNVIKIAARIKENSASDLSFYAFVFRDDIVCLLEKMLEVVLVKHEDSASKYLVKLVNGVYVFPQDYVRRIPNLKNTKIIQNILDLTNLQTVGYHGSPLKGRHIKINAETNEVEKPVRFLNLSNEDQLTAIFTLLEFMYDVFTNKDRDVNLINIAANWFKTI